MRAKQSHKLYFLSILTILFTVFSPIILTAIENAGVLPYTTQNNKVYLLLGNDTHRAPYGWSDFGGGAKDKKNPKKSAAIEGHEETMGRFARNLTDPEPEKYESEGIKYFTDRCLDDNKVESTNYCFYFVPVPYIPSADLNKTRAALKARRIANHYLEKDDFTWIEGQYFLDTILDTIKAGITDKTAITHIKTKISLNDAFVPGKKVAYLSKYIIHSMVQPKSIEILQRLIAGDATVKLQQSLTSLKEKLAKLASVLMTIKGSAKADGGGSPKKFSPTKEEIKKAAAKTGVSEENVRDYVNKNFLGEEPTNYEEFENNLKHYAPKKGEDCYITLVEYQILDLKFENPDQAAVVDALNTSLVLGGGIAGEIDDRDTDGKIKAQLSDFPNNKTDFNDATVKCRTGEAVITESGKIGEKEGCAKWIIHAVGPGGADPERDKRLAHAYAFSLKVADDPNPYKPSLITMKIPNIIRIAFPGISTSIFAGGDPEGAFKKASPVAVNGVLDYVKNNKTGVKEIYMIAFPGADFEYPSMKTVLENFAKDEKDKDGKITRPKRLVEAPYAPKEKQPQSKQPPLRFKIIK